MKVLFFLGLAHPSPGAAWTRIGFFAAYFQRRGHKVDVVGVFPSSLFEKAGARVSDGVRIFNICPTISLQNIFSRLLNIFSYVITLIPFFLFSRPKVVIISIPPVDSAAVAYLASRLARAKVVIDYRDEYEDYKIKSSSGINRTAFKLLKALMTKIYVKSDLVVTVTQSVAESLSLRGVSNVKVVPNGADATVFRPYNRETNRRKIGIGTDDFVIVYSGKIGEYYRLDVAVHALAKLENEIREKVKLLMVGTAPDLPKITAMAKDLGIENNVIYLGVKNDKKELAEIISASDVGLIPYDDNPLWRSALPAKFFEYCACGIPVIATVYEDSILARMLNEHQIGVVVPPLDDESLGKAIKRIYEDHSYRAKSGVRARRFIEENFEREKIAEKFHHLVMEVTK
jgi:glycosyltransferase involved in cell wall biosynthesis